MIAAITQIATVAAQEIWPRVTPLLCPPVSGPALTPDLALDYLGELSTDIRAALVLDSAGTVVAVTRGDEERGERMRTLATELLDAASEASAGGDQVEVVTADGSVFAVRGKSW